MTEGRGGRSEERSSMARRVRSKLFQEVDVGYARSRAHLLRLDPAPVGRVQATTDRSQNVEVEKNRNSSSRRRRMES
eukprot:6071038-Pyramimonas_sp.AAC.1